MNTKTRLLIATLAASVALSFSASAATAPSTGAPVRIAQDQPSTALVALRLPYVPRAREAAAHFTPPEFCYSGKMKVACTLTDVPSDDLNQFTPPKFCYSGKMKVACTLTDVPSDDLNQFTPPKFCYSGKMKVACTLTDAPSKDPTRP
ncbi:hypothetical protein EHF33_20905 (plasmid) [Deinococcus psychrotolerans]|uniref:Uncharacterized protein n=1 Tax=Deinococcus psychrotolerans TaxID=2489213 RepID=A0A3G8YKA5_9DEIO|nr:hypothetical protein [Deinococcus psychrotolerans]AZI45373.1 hypothetical protein EHF33_20905 [Deinococcus psychrotolerans]